MSTTIPVSDLRLKQLAEEPASDLFPAMTVGTAFGPWIILLAFVPSLAGIFSWSLDDRSAAWGLKALDLVQPPVMDHPVVTATEYNAPSLQAAPQLITWLTAATLSLWPVELPWGLFLVSYFSTAGTILAAARLSRRFGVERLASLTTLCCVGCPWLINSAHLAGPEALGLCLLTLSLERFFAHLDSSVGSWSTRLLTAGLAWGGAWLAIGWPALTLGVALAIHAVVFADRHASRVAPPEQNRAGQTLMQKYRRSLVGFWLIGLLTGIWPLWDTIRDHGLLASCAWLFDATPHAASPLFSEESKIALWGAGAGLTFLWGWILLGTAAIVLEQPRILPRTGDGRGIVILVWWLGLLICRLIVAAAGADPTLWDILQTVPACVTAAIGMEAVLQRRVSPVWLGGAILVGLGSLTVFSPLIDSVAIHSAVLLGTVLCLGPVARNLWEARSFSWTEIQSRRALRGLLISTWAAQLAWCVWQAMPDSRVDSQLTRQLRKVHRELPAPGAVIVVSQTAPTRPLVFQLRQQWPDALLVTADHWEAATSRTLAVVDDWADAQFLVVELTRRDSQFRRPAAGWIVHPVSEPRRYYDDQLTLHTVSIQSP